MTLADAITCARAGESDGFACLFEATIPNVWLAAAMLGCPQCGSIVTQIYRKAQQSISSLRSPVTCGYGWAVSAMKFCSDSRSIPAGCFRC